MAEQDHSIETTDLAHCGADQLALYKARLSSNRERHGGLSGIGLDTVVSHWTGAREVNHMVLPRPSSHLLMIVTLVKRRPASAEAGLISVTGKKPEG